MSLAINIHVDGGFGRDWLNCFGLWHGLVTVM